MRAALLVLCLGGCVDFHAREGVIETDQESLLPGYLRPGSQVVIDPFHSFFHPYDIRTAVVPRADGDWLAIDPYPFQTDVDWRDFIRPHTWALAPGRSGVRVTGSERFSVGIGARNEDSTWSLACHDSGGAYAEYDGLERYDTLGDAWCGDAWIGPGYDALHGFTAAAGGRKTAELAIRVEPQDPNDPDSPDILVLEQVGHPKLPDLGGATLVYVEMPAPGVTAAVTVDGDTWVWATSDGTRLKGTGLSGMPVGEPAVWRGEDGRLRVSTTAGLYAWDRQTGAVEQLGTTQPPAVDAAWESATWRAGALAVQTEPNPQAPDLLTVPIAAEARILTDRGLEQFEVPTTPCVHTEDCRTIGESRILGIVQPERGPPMAVYEVWSWFTSDGNDIYGVYLAPAR